MKKIKIKIDIIIIGCCDTISAVSFFIFQIISLFKLIFLLAVETNVFLLSVENFT